MKTKKKRCYNRLTEKLDTMEDKIGKISDSLDNLKKTISTPAQNKTPSGEEVCPDEIEADTAALEAIRDICLGSLFDVESKGEA
jgi:uncharacterized protein (DUF342 family)